MAFPGQLVLKAALEKDRWEPWVKVTADSREEKTKKLCINRVFSPL